MTIEEKRQYILEFEDGDIEDFMNYYDPTGKCLEIYRKSKYPLHCRFLDSEMILLVNLLYKRIKAKEEKL